MDSETLIAEMEAARNGVEDDYFEARPQSDTLANRAIFRAAFERGFNRGYAFSLRPAPETLPDREAGQPWVCNHGREHAAPIAVALCGCARP